MNNYEMQPISNTTLILTYKRSSIQHPFKIDTVPLLPLKLLKFGKQSTDPENNNLFKGKKNQNNS